MELINFLKLLKKHKYMLIAIPVIAIALTYFLIRKMPDTYSSKTRISTGLIDQSRQNILENQSESQENKINQQFSNLIQMMQLKKVLDQVSYKLILHDLTSDTLFHPASKLLGQLNKDARKHAIEVYTALYNNKQPLQVYNKDHNGLRKVIESMGYDDESLLKKMPIYRVNNSDYIDIEYESESPVLCAYVLNTFSEEFINYYSDIVKQNQVKAIIFLDSIIKQKKTLMDNQMSLLKSYKIDNRVLNLNEQAKSLYAQLADFETRKELAEKDILAYTGVLESIEAKFNPNDRKYLESSLTKINQDILNTKEILRKTNEEYIRSNFDDRLKVKIDSLKQILVNQINQSADKYIVNPMSTKQSLVQQKINIEVNLDIAKYSLNSLKAELARLNQKFDRLVPHEAVIQAYEESIDFASKEYIEILKKYNQTNLESSLTVQLKQVEAALPGEKRPSKKMLLVALAGVVSFMVYMLILFGVFYFDHSIKTAAELANATGAIVLGSLPFIKASQLDVEQLWNNDNNRYKNLLNDIRFEIDRDMERSKVLLINSMLPEEGKTIFTLSLAYAYARIYKKVLVIDGNFVQPYITQITNAKYLLEDYLKNNIELTELNNTGPFSVLGMKGGYASLFEIYNENVLQQKMQELKLAYDIILIEAPALVHLNKSKEWLLFCDKIATVFRANQTIDPEKDQFVNYLKSRNQQFMGWVLTQTTEKN